MISGLVKDYASDLRREFKGYNLASLQQDFFAGVTVAAVALPLALAFGVGSGVDAASGLISAIISAFIIGGLSGASFQISGPTGAMTAILIPLAARHGVEGVFVAGALAGAMLLVAGFLRMGKLVYYLPAPVITGFTSGIAIIIALGQAENLFGVKSAGTDTLSRFIGVFAGGLTPNYFALFLGLLVIGIMILWPQKWASKLPGSLAAVFISTIVAFFMNLVGFSVDLVGDIPRTLIHDSRLTVAGFLSSDLNALLLPAFSVATLGMIESLLCGVAGGRMKGEKLNGDRELVAMGIGNLVLPFLGGVPATAAIARSSVAIKSGAKTRLTGIIHGIILLMSMFLLSPLMSRIPLSALAGVLIVTAWRMNEWHSIRYIFERKFHRGALKFLITMLATVAFDLTVAIAAGAIFAVIVFVSEASDLEVTVSEVDPSRLGGRIKPTHHTQVIYVTGPVFFGAIERFESSLKESSSEVLILSMRGVPYIDTSGVQSLLAFCQQKEAQGVTILFAGINTKVRGMLDRSGITDVVGSEAFFFNALDAIGRADELQEKHEQELQAQEQAEKEEASDATV